MAVLHDWLQHKGVWSDFLIQVQDNPDIFAVVSACGPDLTDRALLQIKITHIRTEPRGGNVDHKPKRVSQREYFMLSGLIEVKHNSSFPR
jgi:hypothetical protein